jgi:hypothetical protein
VEQSPATSVRHVRQPLRPDANVFVSRASVRQTRRMGTHFLIPISLLSSRSSERLQVQNASKRHNQLSPNALRIGLEITFALLSSLVVFCVTSVVKRGKAFVAGMDSKLDAIKDNHLAHIQASTGRTAELMEKLVEGQAELNGYIKGKLE